MRPPTIRFWRDGKRRDSSPHAYTQIKRTQILICKSQMSSLPAHAQYKHGRRSIKYTNLRDSVACHGVSHTCWGFSCRTGQLEFSIRLGDVLQICYIIQCFQSKTPEPNTKYLQEVQPTNHRTETPGWRFEVPTLSLLNMKEFGHPFSRHFALFSGL